VNNFVLRVLVAVVGVPILMFATIHGSWPLMTLSLALQAGCLWEWRRIAAVKGQFVSILGALVAIAGIDVAMVVGVLQGRGLAGLSAALAGVGAMLLIETFRRNRAPLAGLSGIALYLVYTAVPLILWCAFAQTDGASRFLPTGPLAALLITTWICDTAAYLGGRALGRHKLYVAASPNKTVEGFVAGVVLSFAVLPLMKLLGWASPNLWDMVALPLVVGVIGQSGDLLESLMKREVNLKDSSAIIPGHGGFLDRFDSLLLSTPFFFAYLVLVSA
jgi:phosphatidate cytidylyltransferase